MLSSDRRRLASMISLTSSIFCGISSVSSAVSQRRTDTSWLRSPAQQQQLYGECSKYNIRFVAIEDNEEVGQSHRALTSIERQSPVVFFKIGTLCRPFLLSALYGVCIISWFKKWGWTYFCRFFFICFIFKNNLYEPY